MDLNRTLSASALILGLYILLTYLLQPRPSSPAQPYHLGCYLTQPNITHHHQLLARIEDINHELQAHQMINVRNALSSERLEVQGVKAARVFEQWMEGYRQYRAGMEVYVELSKAASAAQEDFRGCVNGVNELTGVGHNGSSKGFSQEVCLDSWQAYQNCNGDLELQKRALDDLLATRERYLAGMKELLNREVLVMGAEAPGDDHESKFKAKDRELEEREKKAEAELRLLSQSKSQTEYLYEAAKNTTLHSRKLYLECSQHRFEFRLCEELTEEIKSVGHDSIEKLQDKIQKKQVSLAKMNKLIQQNRQQLGTTSQAKNIYNKNLQDLKKLLKLHAQAKIKIKKHCGCTEKQQQALKQAYDSSKLDQQSRRLKAQQLGQKQRAKYLDLQSIRQERRRNIDQLRQKLDGLKPPTPPSPIDKVAKLAQLRQLLSPLQSLIESSESKFQTLQTQCHKLRQHLSSAVPIIARISNCVNKFHYYEEVKKRYEQEGRNKVALDGRLQGELVYAVREFKL